RACSKSGRWVAPVGLLASPYFEDNILALLGKLHDETEAIRTLLSKIAKLDEKNRRDALEKLQILSGLRSLKPLIEREVEKMPITLNLKDNEFFKEAFAEGEQKGEQKGEFSLLFKQLEKRFGTLPEPVAQRLQNATTDKLERWALNLLDAQSLDEVFR
ncbi:MAG: DUF4351 domain-containing protein, partial [Planctomycetes bacterium]|nr:DUF4351 domain-containing protein [Planctomycetota bacterium]